MSFDPVTFAMMKKKLPRGFLDLTPYCGTFTSLSDAFPVEATITHEEAKSIIGAFGNGSLWGIATKIESDGTIMNNNYVFSHIMAVADETVSAIFTDMNSVPYSFAVYVDMEADISAIVIIAK